MAKQLLPNGSVVTLKGATKKLMTIGIEVEMEGDEKTYIIHQGKWWRSADQRD